MLSNLAFNLLINSVFSFATGLLIVLAAVWMFKIGPGRVELALLGLPFIKILLELAAGVPNDSYLFTGANLLDLPTGHKYLTLGAGFHLFWPVFNICFFVEDQLARIAYSASSADLISAWVAKHISSYAPLALLSVLISVSFFLVARRWRAFSKFETMRKQDRLAAPSLGERSVGRRRVDVYLSTAFEGTPFTGGILRPYVCVPQTTYDRLDPGQREAAIAHELAHVRHWDLPINLVIQFLGDAFWFVPGYRWLARRIDRLREELADRAAVRDGAHPIDLAQALISLEGTRLPPSRLVLYSALVKERSLLKTRIDALLALSRGKPVVAGGRLGWNRAVPRTLITFWIAGAVMTSTLGGNREMRAAPDWIKSAVATAKALLGHH